MPWSVRQCAVRLPAHCFALCRQPAAEPTAAFLIVVSSDLCYTRCMSMERPFSERDIITKYILPAIGRSGWDLQKQVREEVTFTAGRIFVKGRQISRGEKKRADIILYYRANIPVAVIEAKDKAHTVGAGLQQARGYAETQFICWD